MATDLPPAAPLPRHVRLFAPWNWMSLRAWMTVLALTLFVYVLSPVPVAYVLLRAELMRQPIGRIYGVVYAAPHWFEHHTRFGYLFYAAHWKAMHDWFGPWQEPFRDGSPASRIYHPPKI